MGNGNCFFRCLSQHFENHQENHLYYRHLIYTYIFQNRDILKDFFFKESNETTEDYEERYNTFIEAIDKEFNYGWEFKISTVAIALKMDIYIYSKN